MVKKNFITKSLPTDSSGIYRIYRAFTKFDLRETAELLTTLTFCLLNHRCGG